MPTPETTNNSKWWYGRWREHGLTIIKNLDVVVEGERPSERTPADGRRNRQSRFAAEHRLNAIADDAASSRRTEEIAQANRHHLTASSLRFCCLSNYVPRPLPLSNSICLHIPIYSLH